MGVMKWFGHLKIMDDSWMVKRMSSIENWPSGRQKEKKDWVSEAVNQCVKKRNVSLAEMRRNLHNRINGGRMVGGMPRDITPLTRSHSEGYLCCCETWGWIFLISMGSYLRNREHSVRGFHFYFRHVLLF